MNAMRDAGNASTSNEAGHRDNKSRMRPARRMLFVSAALLVVIVIRFLCLHGDRDFAEAIILIYYALPAILIVLVITGLIELGRLIESHPPKKETNGK